VIVYLDSSVVLRVVLKQPEPLPAWGKWEKAYSSEILGVEARRALDRLRLELELGDRELAQAQEDLRRIERTIGLIPLRGAVLRRAMLPMATLVKTLDALHLASALLLEERRGLVLRFATHDGRQATAARALGFECIGV
jgi:predicted nucleic acid-binding protein